MVCFYRVSNALWACDDINNDDDNKDNDYKGSK